jgi:hypothetical protein
VKANRASLAIQTEVEKSGCSDLPPVWRFLIAQRSNGLGRDHNLADIS